MHCLFGGVRGYLGTGLLCVDPEGEDGPVCASTASKLAAYGVLLSLILRDCQAHASSSAYGWPDASSGSVWGCDGNELYLMLSKPSLCPFMTAGTDKFCQNGRNDEHAVCLFRASEVLEEQIKPTPSEVIVNLSATS